MSGKLKEVRGRIASVMSTQQITKAMKLVAASKLRRATQLIEQMRPYENRLSALMSNLIAASGGDITIDLAVQRPVNNALVIVVTSDRGLCGAFNTNVIKQAQSLLAGELKELVEQGKVTMMYAGKKGKDFFQNDSSLAHIYDNVDLIKNLSFDESAKSIETVLKEYQSGTYDAVYVCYAQFKNAGIQFFQTNQFLPVVRPTGVDSPRLNADYIYEPDQITLVDELVPKILKTKFHRFLLDSNASEHGARMTAMDAATTNAEDLLKDLKIQYNKARQATITTEITEIVSGAAALGAS